MGFQLHRLGEHKMTINNLPMNEIKMNLYLEYVNNYLTVETFVGSYSAIFNEDFLRRTIENGRKLTKARPNTPIRELYGVK